MHHVTFAGVRERGRGAHGARAHFGAQVGLRWIGRKFVREVSRLQPVHHWYHMDNPQNIIKLFLLRGTVSSFFCDSFQARWYVHRTCGRHHDYSDSHPRKRKFVVVGNQSEPFRIQGDDARIKEDISSVTGCRHLRHVGSWHAIQDIALYKHSHMTQQWDIAFVKRRARMRWRRKSVRTSDMTVWSQHDISDIED